jgi:hypothetical protein
MKIFLTSVCSFLLGLVIAIVVMWRNAEYIVAKKQEIKKNNRERGTPLIVWHPRRRKFFMPIKEAALLPEADITFQYPRKAELQDKPGIKSEELYDECFYIYIVTGRMTKAEAFKKAMEDHPTVFSLYELKSFTEAMRRREKQQTKKN